MSVCFFSENSLSTDSNPNYKPKKDLENKLCKGSSTSCVFSDLKNQNISDKNNLKQTHSHLVFKGKWSKDEDQCLTNAVNCLGVKNWKNVAQYIEGRSSIQCQHRWSRTLKPGLIKGSWSLEEDRKLLNWVENEGATKWSSCAKLIKGRSGKQCRERYFNTLIPNVRKGNWTIEEDYILFKLFSKYGSQWSKINNFFTGRTENSIKNRFYSTLRRIATEQKKQSDKQNFNENQSESKFIQLAQYIPTALNEKSVNLLNKKRNFNNDSIKSVINPFFNLKTNENKHEEMMNNYHFSSYSSFKLNSNINSVEDKNLRMPYQDIEHSKINEEYNYYNNLPLNYIHKSIQDFNFVPPNDIDNNLSLIENNIEKFMSNFFIKCHLDNENEHTIHRKTNFGCDILEKDKLINGDKTMIKSLIKEIEGLEELLKETKAEILYNNIIKP